MKVNTWDIRNDPDALLEALREYGNELANPGSTDISEEGYDPADLSLDFRYMFSCLDSLMTEGNPPRIWKQKLDTGSNS